MQILMNVDEGIVSIYVLYLDFPLSFLCVINQLSKLLKWGDEMSINCLWNTRDVADVVGKNSVRGSMWMQIAICNARYGP